MRLALCLVILAATLTGQSVSSSRIAVIPLPGKISEGRGGFVLTPSSVLVTDSVLKTQGRQLAAMHDPPTGFDLDVRTGASPRSGFIALRLEKALAVRLGDEGYRIEATPRNV